ncbi:MAG: MiaB/RimO family radical SAM methylthiotransferase [Gemmatimonadota bacterium]|nr:MiaB/RimO family radical SAM methylthiotransferase [Gemmatimonadota bacterium]
MRVYYHTFGCKANQYDTERMRQEGEARGARSTTSWLDAEVCVVNTCTVTNQADAQARRFIRRLHRENPDARVVVAGCSAALKASMYESLDGVAGVVEGHDPVAVALALDPPLPEKPVQIELRRSLDRMDMEPVGGEILRHRQGATRGWLKIQDGCDRKCSFCATRLARGPSRSRDPEEVVREAAQLARHHPELVITGIHIGHFGLDLDPHWSLSRMLAHLLERVPDVRFRLGSVEATEVDDLLLELMETSGGRVAPHLHMPLQSGADPVLRRMRRWHTREMYRSRTLEICDRMGSMGLGADVITGFPGETADDHAQTVALVEELPFTYLHVFPYSPRDGTAAATGSDPVPQRISGERSRELRTLAQEKGSRYREGRVGEEARVVLEGDAALTGDYLRVGWEGPRPEETGVFSATLQGSGEHLYIAWSRDSSLN